MRVYSIAILLLLLLPFFCLSQDNEKPKFKFGKVSPEDFEIKSEMIDSNANAVIISDIGYTDFDADANNKKFSLKFKKEERIKINNRNGFDIATFIIPLYTQGKSSEKLEKLKAYTYNLENGKVVKTSLESSSVFTENATKNIILKKFTLPALKEGCIVEVSYTIESDFLFNLQPWTFQSQYPCLWSEYNASIPSFFNYLPMSQGYQSFFINSKDATPVTYTFRDESRIELGPDGGRVPAQTWQMKGDLNRMRWVMKDVPALKEESYTTTIRNHIAKLEFQLMNVQYPNSMPQNIMSDWIKVSKDLLDDENFGRTISRANNWLDEPMKSITGNAANKLDAAKKIYSYVRNNFTATRNGYMASETNLKDIFNKRNGNVADVNLLLIAMLRHEDIKADPIILSTRGNGVIHPVYPLMDRFNYLICVATIDSNNYFLDATEPLLAFGRLPLKCYNGNARVITPNPMEVAIEPNNLRESKTATFFFMNDANQNYQGSYSSNYGYYESLNIRQAVSKSGKESFIKELTQKYPSEISVSNVAIDSLSLIDEPVKLSCDLSWKFNEDILYVNPLFSEAIKENPFKTAKRSYPVEMPYTTDKTVVVNMEIPKGYVVDELPKSARIKLNENEGMFEYLIAADATNIQLRCKLMLNKAVFSNEDYETLREFFAYVIKKEAEQIVLKKTK